MERYLVVGPIALLIGFSLSALFAPWAKRISHTLGLVDTPGERRIHKIPLPRGGGIGVFASLHLGIWLTASLFGELQGTFDLRWLRGFFLGSSVVFLTGLIDDKFRLSASNKLLGQALGALIFTHFTPPLTQVFGIAIPTEISIIVTLLWILIVTNAFNLIDGIDGLATGLSAISSLGVIGILAERGLWEDCILVTIFFGTMLGFLPFNRHPAKMFLGDCGSNFIGFFLAAVTLSTGAKGSAVSTLAVPLMALAIPLFDISLAVWRRSVRRVLGHMRSSDTSTRITAGDLEHVHHRLLKSGLSVRNVTAVLCLVNSLLVIIGLLSFRSWSNPVAIIFTGILLMSFLLVRYLPLREGWESILVFYYLFSKPKYPFLAVIGYLLWDLFSGLAGIWLAFSISHPDFNVKVLFDEWTGSATAWTVGGVGILFGVESLKASKRTQTYFGIIVLVSSILIFVSDIYFSIKGPLTILTESVMFFLFFSLLSMAGRIAVAGVERTVSIRHGDKLSNPVYSFYSRL